MDSIDSKYIKFSSSAREAMIDGINAVNDATRITLGPKGHYAIMEMEYGQPIMINDGVTIAKGVFLEEQFAQMGAQVLIGAAEKANDSVGDGTTTTIFLTAELIKEGQKLLNSGINPRVIKDNLALIETIIIDEIKQLATPISTIDDYASLATIAGKDQQLGELVREAFQEVGDNGTILVEESRSNYTSLEVLKGYFFEKGFLSSYMMTNPERNEAILDNPRVLLTSLKITNYGEIAPFVDCARVMMQPLLMIVDEIDQEVLSQIVLNKLRGKINCVVVRAPGFNDKRHLLMNDLATYCGGIYLDGNAGYSWDVDPHIILGNVKKATITKDLTVIINQNQDKLASLVSQLVSQLGQTTSEYQKKELSQRLAKIQGGVAVIKVGANSEVELKEMVSRYIDATSACFAGKVSGVVDGGGKVFCHLSVVLKDLSKRDSRFIEPVIEMVRKVLSKPSRQILQNAGMNETILEQLDPQGFKWVDAMTCEVCSLRERGIVDPAETLIRAIRISFSVSSLFLLTDCAIIRQKKPQTNPTDLY